MSNRVREAMQSAKDTITQALLDYVMEKGADFHECYDYYRNDFGIDEEEYDEEGTEVLKILNMFDNNGCHFPYSHSYTMDDAELSDKDEWKSVAFWALYVVREDEELRLKYYALENDGKYYDSDESEPDHAYVNGLSLQELEKLAYFVFDYDKKL